MKKNRGFLLIETASVFLLTGILLLAALRLYGSSIMLRQRCRDFEHSWQAAQRMLFCGEEDVPGGKEICGESNGLMVREIQVAGNDGKICCNLVWIEK